MPNITAEDRVAIHEAIGLLTGLPGDTPWLVTAEAGGGRYTSFKLDEGGCGMSDVDSGGHGQ